jgi:hypothetical protein
MEMTVEIQTNALGRENKDNSVHRSKAEGIAEGENIIFEGGGGCHFGSK